MNNCTFGCIQAADNGDDTCAGDHDCLCQDEITHCGSFFPKKCGLEPDGLYTCTTGLAPNLTQDCLPGICSANVADVLSVDDTSFFKATADDFCIDQCACKQANTSMCASKFPADCGYNNNSVVFCDKIAE
ncbi:hypothetical protein BGZ65_003636, partial [Modicella reniformis]